MRATLSWASLAVGVALGGSATPAEAPAVAAARHGQSCREASFAEGTPDFQLCLRLQWTDERLNAVERRLARIDRDTGSASPYVLAGPRWWSGNYR